MSLITKDGFIYIPQYMEANYKIYIGSTDVTDDVTKCEVELVATEEISRASIRINDSDNTYTNTLSGGEAVTVYLDFSSGTNKIFSGTISKFSTELKGEGMVLKLTCGHDSDVSLDLTVTEEYESTEVSVILKALIDEYLPSFTYVNVNTTTTNATVKWGNKPFWDCVKELCYIAGYDCYVDNDKDFHFFERSSIINTDEVVVDDILINVDGLGENLLDTRNKIIVYGESLDGTTIVATSSESTGSNVKEKIINDNKLRTYNDCKDRADAELELLKDSETKGSVKTFPLPLMNQGEKIWLSLPSHEIHDTYRIEKVVHNILEFYTELQVQTVKKLPNILKDGAIDTMQKENVKNKYKMEQTLLLTFDSSDELSNSPVDGDYTITSGSVHISGNGTVAEIESNSRTEDSNITSCVLNVKGQDYSMSDFYVSNNNGLTWEEIDPETEHTFSSTGKVLKIKIRLIKTDTDVNPKLDGITLLYK